MADAAMVWLADDDRGVRFVLAAALRDAGLQVTEFEDAESVLACIDEQLPDLLFTDVRMAGQGGLKLLERLHDTELQLPADQDALTTPELLASLSKSIFTELGSMPAGEYTNRKPAISSLRRNLQRAYLKRLSELAMGRSGAPQDCQTVAFSELSALEGKINELLKNNSKLDAYSKAHLEESASRIHRVLDARFNLTAP